MAEMDYESASKTKAIDIEKASKLISEIGARFESVPDAREPWVVNIDLWYTEAAKKDLSRLKHAIEMSSIGGADDFVWATFSATARKCSRADARFAVPVRKKLASEERISPDKTVWSVFAAQYASKPLGRSPGSAGVALEV